jgi:cytochrome b561
MFRHLAIRMGCTLNCEPSGLSVFSPRSASIATRAFNFALYVFLVVVISLSLAMTPSES